MTVSPRAVFAGVATEDAIAVVDRYPGADERVVANEMIFGGGGPAATAAVAASRLGIPSAVIAATGDDEAAASVRSRLASEGVDTSAITRIPGAETSRSIIVVSGAERSRAIVNRVGPPLDLARDERAVDLLARAEWVHVDQHGWAAVDAVRRRWSGGPRLSIDGGNDIADLALEGTALYAPTREALERRYGPGALDELLRRAIADGADAVVATDGGRGSYGLTSDGLRAEATPPASEIVSTLGAGDVFHGALVAGLIHTSDGTLAGGFQAAIAYATTVATLSCRGLDGRTRIPNHDETIRALARPRHTDEQDLLP